MSDLYSPSDYHRVCVRCAGAREERPLGGLAVPGAVCAECGVVLGELGHLVREVRGMVILRGRLRAAEERAEANLLEVGRLESDLAELRALLEERGEPARDEAGAEVPDAERVRRLLARASGGLFASEERVRGLESDDEEPLVGELCRVMSNAEALALAAVRAGTLAAIQRRVAREWTLADYGADFLASEAPHRDFAHALLHVVKAAGRLAGLVDEADHARTGGAPLLGDLARGLLADLVVCAARMALTVPGGPVSLENAVLARLDQIRERYARRAREGGGS